MNKRLKELAFEAGFTITPCGLFEAEDTNLERFAKFVRQDEREVCSKLCDDLQLTDLAIRDWADGTYDCAKAIRSRGNHEQD